MFLDTSDLHLEDIYLRLDKKAEADPVRGWVPAYYFSICRAGDNAKVGRCDLRLGHTEKLFFSGNIGYTVFEPYRGNHYACKACLLLLDLARRHNMGYLHISCSPDNLASRRTCERAGGALLAIVNLPTDHDLYQMGKRQECIYLFTL